MCVALKLASGNTAINPGDYHRPETILLCGSIGEIYAGLETGGCQPCRRWGGALFWAFVSPDARNVLASFGIGAEKAAPVEVAQATPGQAAKPGQNGGAGRSGGNATLVVTAPVKQGTVNDRLNAIGNGEAIQSVVVMPQTSGTISEILISSGAKVKRARCWRGWMTTSR